jgi:medium-chain acyl-[acyl-carrier-protein] hydrolase
MEQMKLFCLPYAGGSATIYSKLKQYLDPLIQLLPVELAGRGRRFNSDFYNTMEEAVDDIYSLIKNQLDGSKYALFGHSMGSILIYELYQKIRYSNRRLPDHLFFSGHGAPQIIKQDFKMLHTLNDEEFSKEIRKLGGTPLEILENQDLLKVFFPILRADYKIIDLYRHNDQYPKMDCNISVLHGNKDDIEMDAISAWKQCTNKDCRFYFFNGGHFFIFDYYADIAKIINNTLVGTCNCTVGNFKKESEA